MSGRGLDPETVEQDPSQVKASKRLKQVEEKRRIEAQCDGHLLENEKVNPRNVTQRPKNMSKDDAKRVAWDAAWKSPTERKGRFFFEQKNQWAKRVAGEPEQGPDPETGGLVPIQFLQIWKNQLFTWWATVTLNHLLFGTLFSKEVWSWAKVCSKFSSLCFPFVFASLLSTRNKQSFFPQSCVPREAKCANYYKIIATNSWENSDSTSAHMVLYLESEKKTLQKKGELSKLTKSSWTCSSPATYRWEAVRQECLVWHWC